MVHTIEWMGRYIALDVESGTVLEIDRDAMRVLTFLDAGKTEKQIIADLGEGARDVLSEIRELEEEGLLFSEPALATDELVFNEPVVKALCLLIAQDCNLRCAYCFAGEGKYRKERGLMEYATAKAALDFLVKNSGNRKNLEVDFFGGEPLLNFEVLKKTVEYGRELEKKHNKTIRFTLTTNAYHVTDEMVGFINREMKNIVISIDGRGEVHDALRKNAAGQGSYEKVLRNAKRIVQGRNGREYYIRGTYTAQNLDFSNDVCAIADAGFDQISLEPVVTGEGIAIREEHIPQIRNEYETLANIYMKRKAGGKPFHFFHFMVDLDAGPCLNKRLRGCGAGSEYLAVAADGSLYPCHQFCGMDDFYMGDVFEGTIEGRIRNAFLETHVFSKEECTNCWAKYYCSGGCSANAYFTNGDMQKPYKLGCEMEKKRIEMAIALQVFAGEKQGEKI
ncbi:MAG: thioether cross-link-forming SCIFF peptide maturase [Christensenellaceae bacterium]